MCITCFNRLFLDLLISNIWRAVRIITFLVYSFSPPPVTFSIVVPNIPLITLFSVTLSLCLSVSERTQVPLSQKTIGRKNRRITQDSVRNHSGSCQYSFWTDFSLASRKQGSSTFGVIHRVQGVTSKEGVIRY